jgi:hypothetical protein
MAVYRKRCVAPKRNLGAKKNPIEKKAVTKKMLLMKRNLDAERNPIKRKLGRRKCFWWKESYKPKEMSLVLKEKEVWKMQMFQILKYQNNLLERMRHSVPSRVILWEGRIREGKEDSSASKQWIRERKRPYASSNRNELENENLEKVDVPLTKNVAMEIDCPSTSNSKTNAGPSETNVDSQLKENALCQKKMLAAEK